MEPQKSPIRLSSLFLTEQSCSDKGEVLRVVKRNGLALQFASLELKADKEVVMEAVKNDGESLKYASKELKSDSEVVFNAFKNTEEALQYAGDIDTELATQILNCNKGSAILKVEKNGNEYDCKVPLSFNLRQVIEFAHSELDISLQNRIPRPNGSISLGYGYHFRTQSGKSLSSWEISLKGLGIIENQIVYLVLSPLLD